MPHARVPFGRPPALASRGSLQRALSNGHLKNGSLQGGPKEPEPFLYRGVGATEMWLLGSNYSKTATRVIFAKRFIELLQLF
jgi:hypothetical protein